MSQERNNCNQEALFCAVGTTIFVAPPAVSLCGVLSLGVYFISEGEVLKGLITAFVGSYIAVAPAISPTEICCSILGEIEAHHICNDYS